MRRLFSSLLFTGLLAGLSLPGCMVPQNRYDTAVERGHAEHEGRVRAQAALAAARAEVARLNALLDERRGHIDTRDQELSRSKLDEARLMTERDDAVALVDQLRGELARAGDHLREYSEQKQALEAALAEAALPPAPDAEGALRVTPAAAPEAPAPEVAAPAPAPEAPAPEVAAPAPAREAPSDAAEPTLAE